MVELKSAAEIEAKAAAGAVVAEALRTVAVTPDGPRILTN